MKPHENSINRVEVSLLPASGWLGMKILAEQNDGSEQLGFDVEKMACKPK